MVYASHIVQAFERDSHIMHQRHRKSETIIKKHRGKEENGVVMEKECVTGPTMGDRPGAAEAASRFSPFFESQLYQTNIRSTSYF